MNSEHMTLPMPVISEDKKWDFWSKVALTCNPNKCWNWTGNKDKRGYGKLVFVPSPYVRRTLRAARVAYYLHTGVDPVGKIILHTCDNPECVNPNHLKVGTTQDNVDDKIKKGRLNPARGSALPQTKLTEAQVLEIRQKCNSGMLQKDVAEQYGVNQRNISKIMTGIRWKHI